MLAAAGINTVRIGSPEELWGSPSNVLGQETCGLCCSKNLHSVKSNFLVPRWKSKKIGTHFVPTIIHELWRCSGPGSWHITLRKPFRTDWQAMLLMEVLPCDDPVVLVSILRSFCVPSYFTREKILSAKLNCIVRNRMGVSLFSELHVSGWCHGFPGL